MERCELEVMSPNKWECFKTRVRAQLVGPSTVSGKFVIEVAASDRATAYEAWPRPGGEPWQFVCGAMAPGEPK